MPGPVPFERQLPCLLVRLTDEEPDSQKESREQRGPTLRRYREAVTDDLRWLFDAGQHPLDDPIYEHDEVACSVLNYGIPDLCGLTGSGVDAAELGARLRQAILAFEPRILRNSLSVRVLTEPEQVGENALAVELACELWAQPAPDPFYVRTVVDLETGEWAF